MARGPGLRLHHPQGPGRGGRHIPQWRSFPRRFPMGMLSLPPIAQALPPYPGARTEEVFQAVTPHSNFFEAGAPRGLLWTVPKREVFAKIGQGRNSVQVFSRRLEHTKPPPLFGRPRIDRINPPKTRGFLFVVDWRRLPTPESHGRREGGGACFWCANGRPHQMPIAQSPKRTDEPKSDRRIEPSVQYNNHTPLPSATAATDAPTLATPSSTDVLVPRPNSHHD